MLKPGYQQYNHITKQGTKYTFHNFRDFTWTSEDLDQIQNRREETIDLEKITSLDMYICPFMLYNAIGHTILTFGFSDGKKVCLTVESELKLGEEYHIFKGIYPGYRIRYLRGTEKDFLNLRIFRHEKPYKYPIHLNIPTIKKLFLDVVQETNKAESKPEQYNLIFNNCTSGLRRTARKHLPIPKRHYSLLFNAFLPKFLHNLGVVKLQEKKPFQKI